jgi:hypothetical protein
MGTVEHMFLWENGSIHDMRDALHFLLLLEEVAARESAHRHVAYKNGRF